MFRKFALVMTSGVMAFAMTVSTAFAGEIDLLVQKLVEKGVLSAGEAQELIVETKEEIKKQNAKGTNESIPAWIQTTKIKGDLRMRQQMLKEKTNSVEDNLTRARVRLGVETRPNDQMKVGIGIATGKLSDPRSTNVSLGTDGSSSTTNTPGSFKNIILDYAYAQYSPLSNFTFTAGKFKNPLWQPNDLLWDGDLNPEGASFDMTHKLFDGLEFFGGAMVFILDEQRVAKDSEPYMWVVQPGFKAKLTEKSSLKGAVAYYNVNSVKERAVFSKRSTNTTKTIGATTAYKYDYDAVNPSLEISFVDPFFAVVPYASIFADYVKNVSLPSNTKGDDGYDVGVKFGYEKVSDWKQWQAKLSYNRLGTDAFLDIFPDSDRYNGKTNMRSYEAIFEFGLGKNTSLAFDYYYGESLTKTGSHNSQQHLYQLDWNLKF